MPIDIGWLNEVTWATREEILKTFRKDSCIATTRAIIEVLAHFDIAARPLAVTTLLFNDAYALAAQSEGAFPQSQDEFDNWQKKYPEIDVVGIGKVTDSDFPAHLVGVIDDRILIDGSLDQLASCQPAVTMEPRVFELNEERFKQYGIELLQYAEGWWIKYRAVATDERYANAPNWRTGWEPAVAAVVREFNKQ